MSEDDSHYFDHEADIGIIGQGETIEDAFVAAAEAMFAIMADLSQITPKKTIHIKFDESDKEFAFIIWLNQLLAEAHSHNIVLRKFQLRRDNHHWIGQASGDTWNDNMTRGTEVKGATLTMLSVKQNNGGWEARCVVDV